MNDLISRSFARFRSEDDDSHAGNFQMSSLGDASNLDTFFLEVQSIKDDLKELKQIQQRLRTSHEQIKISHDAQSLKDLRSLMESQVSIALNKAKAIKLRLESLDRSNAANRTIPGCGKGSSSDRTRTSVVGALRKNLRDNMDSFNGLRRRIASDHRETVEHRYFTVTGENPDEETVDRLISTGESETFLQKAIQDQGRGRILDTILEIQERQDGANEMERNLKELHQVFLDMAVLVEVQGEQLDDIESQVARANSFVSGGTRQLQTARHHQKNSRKWFCYAIVLILVIVLFIVLFTVKPWQKNGGGRTAGASPPPPT